MNIDIARLLMFVLSFVLAITVHEFGHAVAADRLGDGTPRQQGRLTLDPLHHLDPIGMVVLIIFSMAGLGFGWGKPVITNPQNFKDPRKGDIIVSAAGPAMNLLLAIVLGIVVRTGSLGLPPSSPYYELITVALEVNIVLFLFNLIPVPPLDGAHILADLLPYPMAKSYQAAMANYGWILIVLLLVLGSPLLSPAIYGIEKVLAG